MKLDKRIERLEKDRRLAEANSDFLEAANVCNQLGSLLCENGQMKKAFEVHENERQLCEIMNDKMGQGVACRRLGECLLEMETDSQGAIDFLVRYLTIATEEKNLLEEQRAHATLGRAYLRLAESETRQSTFRKTLLFAEDSFRESMRLCDNLRSQLPTLEFWQMKARLLLNLGILHDIQENEESSSTHMKEALIISQKQNFFEDVYRCQHSLADLARRHDNRDPAVRFACACAKTAQKMANKDRVKDAKILRGLVHLNFGEFSDAKRILTKIYRKQKAPDARLILLLKTAVKCCRDSDAEKDSTNAEFKMKIHENIGDALCTVDLYNAAIRHYKKVVSIAHDVGKVESTLADIYSSIGQSYVDLKKYSSAIAYFEKEMRSRPDDQEQLCQTLLNVADCYERQGKEYSELLQTYNRAKAASIEASKPVLQMRVLRNLAECQKSNNRREDQNKTERELKELEEFHQEEEEEEEEEEEKEDLEEEGMISDLSSVDEDSSADEGEEFDRPLTQIGSRRRRSFKVTKNEKGETRLHTACIHGNIKQVRSLLQKNHPTNVRDFCGWTPLQEAANHGFQDIVEELIDHGADVNDPGGAGCRGTTPLHDACSCGNYEVIQVLLAKGASTNLKNDKGQTALNSLHLYVKQGKMDDEERSQLHRVDQILRGLTQDSAPNHLPDVFEATHKRSRSSRGQSLSESESDCEIVSSNKRSKSVGFGESEEGPMFGLDSTERDLIADPLQAPCAYSSAISDLGSKAKSVPQKNIVSSVKATKKSAHLQNQEVGDDWLIDDIGGVTRKSVRDPLCSQRRSSPIQLRPLSPLTPESEISEPELMTFEPVPSPPSPVLGAAPVLTQMQEMTSNIKVKVRVLETLVLVPLTISDQSRSVSWLCDEVSERYYRIHNQRPVVSLTMSDGAMILPEDSISAILSDNEEICGRVVKWEMLPLATKYKDACVSSQSRFYLNIEQCLAQDTSNSRVDLSQFCVTPGAFLPISRALVNHLSLCELSLRGCPLGPQGAEYLANILPSLKNLQSLNLAICALNSLALSTLANCDSTLDAMQSLDLSYNLFEDAAMPRLISLLKKFPCLRNLKVVSSGFTRRKFNEQKTILGVDFSEVWTFNCPCL